MALVPLYRMEPKAFPLSLLLLWFSSWWLVYNGKLSVLNPQDDAE